MKGRKTATNSRTTAAAIHADFPLIAPAASLAEVADRQPVEESGHKVGTPEREKIPVGRDLVTVFEGHAADGPVALGE
jgi:hypothetical protein